MPYISKESRRILQGAYFKPENVGELNYLISYICNEYMNQEGLRYQTINNIIGVLECAKQEFYRRVATPYEDLKILENGDVYSTEVVRENNREEKV